MAIAFSMGGFGGQLQDYLNTFVSEEGKEQHRKHYEGTNVSPSFFIFEIMLVWVPM